MTIQLRPVTVHRGTPGCKDHKVTEIWEGTGHSHGRPIYVERECPWESAAAIVAQMRVRWELWGPEAPKTAKALPMFEKQGS